ncbi:MAG: hypothetical protein RAK19_06800 [Synechococcus sp. SP1 MAG]|nr:hypothetical protein [Synechococcus sp. SP1 MAG]
MFSVVMLKSVDAVHIAVHGPLTKACGPTTRLLTAEVHGPEVRGLALCPGRVVRFVFDARNEQFKTMDHLRLA